MDDNAPVALGDRGRIDVVNFTFCESFELYSGLPFEADAITQPEQTRDRIEESARTRGQRRVEPSIGSLAQYTPGGAVQTSHERQIERRHRVAIGRAKERRRHAPRLAHCCVTTGQRYILEMTDALEASQVGDEELATPDAAVGSIAASVPGDADYLAIHTVVGQTARDVRVMMLDGHSLDALQGPRIDRRAIRRMEIVRHDLRV